MHGYKIKDKVKYSEKSTALYLNSECEFDQTYLSLVCYNEFQPMNIRKLELFIPVE